MGGRFIHENSPQAPLERVVASAGMDDGISVGRKARRSLIFGKGVVPFDLPKKNFPVELRSKSIPTYQSDNIREITIGVAHKASKSLGAVV
jgi:hypothetical protein